VFSSSPSSFLCFLSSLYFPTVWALGKAPKKPIFGVTSTGRDPAASAPSLAAVDLQEKWKEEKRIRKMKAGEKKKMEKEDK
jgi:hypothetical protein